MKTSSIKDLLDYIQPPTYLTNFYHVCLNSDFKQTGLVEKLLEKEIIVKTGDFCCDGELFRVNIDRIPSMESKSEFEYFPSKFYYLN